MPGVRASLVALAAAALAAGAAPGAAVAAESLPLTAADAPGLTALAGPLGTAKARALLVARTPKPSRAAARRVPLQGGILRAPGVLLVDGVAAYPAEAPAVLALQRWGGRRVIAGDAARIRATKLPKGRAQALGAVRVGDTLGILQLSAAGTPAAVTTTANAYLAALARRILRIRGRPGEDRILKGVNPDGTAPLPVALQNFALHYGALPGVPQPSGPVVGDGTGAIGMVLNVRDQLTPAQQAAVDERIQGGLPGRRRSLRALTLTPTTAYQLQVDAALGAYAPLLGPLPIPVRTYLASEGVANNAADALPTDDNLNLKLSAPNQCRIRIFPTTLKDTPANVEQIIFHEVFHCYEFAITTKWFTFGNWLIEGMADWASLTLRPVLARAFSLSNYYSSPGTSVLTRSYDGVGFWGAVAQYVPGGLWPIVRTVLGAAGPAAAFQAADGDGDYLKQQIASATFRNSLGPPWRQTSPLAIQGAGAAAPSTLLTDSAPVSAPAYGIGIYLVRPKGKKLVKTVTASGYMRAGGETDFGNADGKWFCVGGECKCKPNEESDIPSNTPAFSGVVLGIAGGSQSASGGVEVRDPRDFCRKKGKESPKKAPADSNGDPHLTSLDGLHYDFQAAGEFTLVRSQTGDLEIQARQEEIRKGADLTLDTMFGLRADGHRVTLTPTSGDPAARVDGRAVTLVEDTPLAVGAASLERHFGGVTLTWPDGSRAEVRSVGSYGLFITVALVDARAGKVAGLFGNFDGNPGNDLATRAGKAIRYTTEDAGYGFPARVRPKERGAKAFLDGLYDTVGDSWRITQAGSLLDYGPGQTTKTFTDRAVPERKVSSSELAAAARRRAEAACRAAGITDPGPLEDCIVDVAATGDTAYATAAAEALEAARAPWVRMDGGSTIDARPEPVRTTDGTIHLLYEDRGAGDARTVADLRIAPDGREQPPVTAITGDVKASGAAAPDGSLTAFYAAVKDPGGEGIFRASATAPWASWTEGPPVTDTPASQADEPVATIAGDGTAFVATGLAGMGRLFRSAAGGPAGAGVPLDPDPTCNASAPGVTTDAAGGVWATWYRWNCAQPAGLMAARVDPATGAVGPATLAPGSHWSTPSDGNYDLPLDDHAAIAPVAGATPGGVVAYFSRTGENLYDIRLWRIGDPAPVLVGRETGPPAELRVSAEPGPNGRLWVAWRRYDARVKVVHTAPGALAPDGAPTLLGNPRDLEDGGRAGLGLVAEDGAATVLFSRVGGVDGKNAIWRLRLRP